VGPQFAGIVILHLGLIRDEFVVVVLAAGLVMFERILLIDPPELHGKLVRMIRVFDF